MSIHRAYSPIARTYMNTGMDDKCKCHGQVIHLVRASAGVFMSLLALALVFKAIISFGITFCSVLIYRKPDTFTVVASY